MTTDEKIEILKRMNADMDYANSLLTWAMAYMGLATVLSVGTIIVVWFNTLGALVLMVLSFVAIMVGEHTGNKGSKLGKKIIEQADSYEWLKELREKQ